LFFSVADYYIDVLRTSANVIWTTVEFRWNG